VYYNKDIFAKLGLAIPNTWEEFLAVSDKLLKAGYTPLANGLGEEWDINECFMMGILPSFIGGRDGRLAYEAGKTPFNDAKMVKAFQAMGDVAKYCPRGFEALTYNDANALFATGKAAMFADGSWTLDTFKDVPFKWGNFAFPAPAGMKSAITFHADSGLAMNPKTKHPAEAQAFLEWMCTPEGATVAAKYLPNGFYPMINANIKINDAHSAELYSLIQGKMQDVRFTWPRLMNGDPSGYVLMNQGAIAVMKGQITTQQAADNFAAGLAKWYKP
jgi:raffinose/stachyose/melibiose transport system substrate-binding protein